MLQQSFFWFSEPPSYLISFDRILGWVFVGMVVLGIILKLTQRFANPANQILLSKFGSAFLDMGLIELLWFGIRYEGAPIFSLRIWPATIFAIFLVWIGFIIKYIFTGFRVMKREHEKQMLNSRYIPGKR